MDELDDPRALGSDTDPIGDTGPMEDGGPDPLPADLVRAIEAVVMVASEPVPPQLLDLLRSERRTNVLSAAERLGVKIIPGA